MVVRKAAAGLQDLFTGGVLDLVENQMRIVHVLRIECKVEINDRAGLVELGYACGDKGFAGQLATTVFFGDAPFDIVADIVNPRPGHRCLERFGHQIVVEHEVADVGDAKGKLIAAFAVFAAAAQPAVSPGDAVDVALLILHLFGGPFEYQGAGDHLLRFEAFDPGHKKLLQPALATMPGALIGIGRLQRHAQLELQIVDQPGAGRPLILLR